MEATYDIHAVISYLRKLNPNIEIALWGRSMGAVAGIRYCTQNTDIKALVLDSPFGSLRELALHIGNQKTWLPYFIIDIFLSFLNPRIKEKSGV
jgi:pimeloyl-ACP methyl ester carboxylesterase